MVLLNIICTHAILHQNYLQWQDRSHLLFRGLLQILEREDGTQSGSHLLPQARGLFKEVHYDLYWAFLQFSASSDQMVSSNPIHTLLNIEVKIYIK